jgi:Bacterial PH domain
VGVAEAGLAIQTETFIASRWTSGNWIFPTQIVVSREHVLRIKQRWLGSDQESIAIGKVASVRITTGLLWSDIRIDSAGGSNPILSHGHRKRDAERIRDLIEKYQTEATGAASS